MIRQSGVEPEIIEYLKTPPSRAKLLEQIKAMDVTVRDLLRERGTPRHELGLDDPKLTDDELIDQMLAHPSLINRPIVVTEKGVKLCRRRDRSASATKSEYRSLRQRRRPNH
jgi:arsenate reductase